ncbi:MAG: hypothetical protein PVH68_16245 [Armatimonadota bacterium]
MVRTSRGKQDTRRHAAEAAQADDSAKILQGFIECVEARRSAREQKIPPRTSDPQRVEEPN